jgi:hypothetical protein
MRLLGMSHPGWERIDGSTSMERKGVSNGDHNTTQCWIIFAIMSAYRNLRIARPRLSRLAITRTLPARAGRSVGSRIGATGSA